MWSGVYIFPYGQESEALFYGDSDYENDNCNGSMGDAVLWYQSSAVRIFGFLYSFSES